MTARTLAERVAALLSDKEYSSFCPVCGEFPNGQPAARDSADAIAEFVLAADEAITELEALPGRYDAALAALAKALGIEEEDQ